MKTVIPWLLWKANAHPPLLHRREFYALKDRLLQGAEHVGWDWQHIKRECYRCDGLGGFADSTGRCYRCAGTGIYAEHWVALERLRLGRYTFHKPWKTSVTPPRDGMRVIEGFIRHEHTDAQAAHEAGLWLALLCDRRLFWKLLRTEGRFTRPRWLPMVRLACFVSELADSLHALRIRWRLCRPHRCESCSRWLTGPRVNCAACDLELPF